MAHRTLVSGGRGTKVMDVRRTPTPGATLTITTKEAGIIAAAVASAVASVVAGKNAPHGSGKVSPGWVARQLAKQAEYRAALVERGTDSPT